MVGGSSYAEPMIDGHNDLPWVLRTQFDAAFAQADISRRFAGAQTDIPRLREGGVTGQFWSVYVPSNLVGNDAVTATLEQIDLVHRMIARYPEALHPAGCAADCEAALAQGKIASLIGVEGGHSINESLGILRMLHGLGARYMTLTHNDNTPWADSATDEAVLHGLSEFGESVVAEMNRIGMLVDLSHVSADVMRHAMRASRAPIIFSHSSARAVCDVPRNVPDDVLAQLPTNGGVCMVTFVAEFVSPRWAEFMNDIYAEIERRGGNPRLDHDLYAAIERDRMRLGMAPVATIDDLALHFEHVGVGGDFDGCSNLPVGLTDVGGYPRLFANLAERGWSDTDLAAIQRGNILRVMRDARCGEAAQLAKG
jgi:membrane dipeptidase